MYVLGGATPAKFWTLAKDLVRNRYLGIIESLAVQFTLRLLGLAAAAVVAEDFMDVEAIVDGLLSPFLVATLPVANLEVHGLPVRDIHHGA